MPEVLKPPEMVPTESHLQPGFLGSFSCIAPVLIRWTAFSSGLSGFLPFSPTPTDILVKARAFLHFFLGGVGAGAVGSGHSMV